MEPVDVNIVVAIYVFSCEVTSISPLRDVPNTWCSFYDSTTASRSFLFSFSERHLVSLFFLLQRTFNRYLRHARLVLEYRERDKGTLFAIFVATRLRVGRRRRHKRWKTTGEPKKVVRSSPEAGIWLRRTSLGAGRKSVSLSSRYRYRHLARNGKLDFPLTVAENALHIFLIVARRSKLFPPDRLIRFINLCNHFLLSTFDW